MINEKTNRVSEKKLELIRQKRTSPIAVGESVGIADKYISEYKPRDPEKIVWCIVNTLAPLTVWKEDGLNNNSKAIPVNPEWITNRSIADIGADPFPPNRENVETKLYQIDSILDTAGLGDRGSYMRKELSDHFGTPVGELNWNPFVMNKAGEAVFYQRDFVWTLSDKQLLIESIYQGIDCGRIIVRKRDWKWLEQQAKKGNKDLFFRDIVDGKQRLNALGGFVNNVFPDFAGNHFSDLSARAQNRFLSSMLFGFGEMPESTTDAAVIQQFLKMNFTGVPQSAEHIEFVKSINVAK